MTDLDVYFWRFFAAGAGFAFVWCVYPWAASMGRSWRMWYTTPEQARYVYGMIYDMFRQIDKHPEWYRRYVTFREVGMGP